MDTEGNVVEAIEALFGVEIGMAVRHAGQSLEIARREAAENLALRAATTPARLSKGAKE